MFFLSLYCSLLSIHRSEGCRHVKLHTEFLTMLIEERSARTETPCLSPKARKVAIVFCLSLVFGCVGAVNSLIAPFYPKEALAKGAGPQISGMIFASYTLATVFMGPITAILSSRVSLNFLLISGLFLEGSTQFLFGFLSQMPAGLCFIIFSFLIRIIGGIGSSPCFTAGMTIGIGTFPDQLPLLVGIFESCYGVGLMMGPPIGGLLYAAGGFRLPFFVLGSATLTFALPFLFVLSKERDNMVPQSAKKTEEKLGVLKLLRVPTVILMTLLLFAALVFTSCLRPILVFHLDRYSLTESEVGLVFFIPPAFYTALSTLYGYFVKEKYNRIFMSLGFFVVGIGFLLLGPSPLFHNKLPSILGVDAFALALNGIGTTPIVVSAIPEMTNGARKYGLPDNEMTCSAISGLWLTVISIGALTGPALSGWLYDFFGFAWVTTFFAIWSFLQILIIAVYFILQRPKGRASKAVEETKPLLHSEWV